MKSVVRRRVVVRLVVALMLLCFGFGVAQEELYFGVGLGGALVPLPYVDFGIQMGSALSENLDVRFAVNSIVVFNDVALDFLYEHSFSDTHLNYYLGGGPRVFLAIIPSIGSLFSVGAQVTAGIEQPIGPLGLYAEVQAGTYIVPLPLPFLKLRTGLNFYIF